MKTVIFDLDGTLADIEERRSISMLPNGKMNWGKFFNPDNIKLDKPNWPVISAFRAMRQFGYKCIILSGRSDVTKDVTLDWLDKYGIYPHDIKMRPGNDYTPDDILKKTWLDELRNTGHDISCVYDDRDKVVKMWRENGVTCFQVNYGPF